MQHFPLSLLVQRIHVKTAFGVPLHGGRSNTLATPLDNSSERWGERERQTDTQIDTHTHTERGSERGREREREEPGSGGAYL